MFKISVLVIIQSCRCQMVLCSISKVQECSVVKVTLSVESYQLNTVLNKQATISVLAYELRVSAVAMRLCSSGRAAAFTCGASGDRDEAHPATAVLCSTHRD